MIGGFNLANSKTDFECTSPIERIFFFIKINIGIVVPNNLKFTWELKKIIIIIIIEQSSYGVYQTFYAVNSKIIFCFFLSKLKKSICFFANHHSRPFSAEN